MARNNQQMPCAHLIAFVVLISLTMLENVHAAYGNKLCQQEGFKCVRVKNGQSWQSRFPDFHDRSIAMRINRMNTPIYPGMVIAVPDQIETARLSEFSPLPLQIEAPREKVIIIDPTELAWGAYDADGNLVRWGPASLGANYCKDIDNSCQTHSGSFRIFSVGSSDCSSTKFPLPRGGAPMPYCMYFNDGQAIHGEPNGLPGYNASHGCVRLYVNDAQWLRYDFVEGPNANNNYRGTKVVVKAYPDEIYETDGDEWS